MKHWAIGWACTIQNLFVRFPYEKFKNLRTLYKKEREQKVYQVFREGIRVILDDIIENNNTFKIQGIGYQKGELHFEAIKGGEFEKSRKNGKFEKVDFLNSLFTGYQLYLFVSGKRDNVLHRRKFPVYFNKYFRDKLIENTNNGKVYC